MSRNEELASALEKLAVEIDRLETQAKEASLATDELYHQYTDVTGSELDDSTRAFLESRPAIRSMFNKTAAPVSREPMGEAVIKTATNGDAPSADPFTSFANRVRDLATRE